MDYLELKNKRLPNALQANLLENQILKKFPMDHPLTSQISYKAVFPNYTAPEDSCRGEEALKSQSCILTGKTPTQTDPIIVANKQSGKPWRHEIRYEKLPSQKQGLWYNDKELYHVCK